MSSSAVKAAVAAALSARPITAAPLMAAFGAIVDGLEADLNAPVSLGGGTLPHLFDYVTDAGLRQQISSRDPNCPDLAAQMQKAHDTAAGFGQPLLLPGGTIPFGTINDQGALFKQRINSVVRGAGASSTVLKQMPNVNAMDVATTDHASDCWSAGDGFVNHAKRTELSDIVIDQNCDNNALAAGSLALAIGSAAMRVYGLGHVRKNITIRNATGSGMRVNFKGDDFPVNDAAYATGNFYDHPENVFEFCDFCAFDGIYIWNCGDYGWANQGPSDQHFRDIWCVDCSRIKDATFAAIWNAAGANFRGSMLHAYSSQGATNRQSYGFFDQGGACNVSLSHFESSMLASVRLSATGTQLTNCSYYARRGANNGDDTILVDGPGRNLVQGQVFGPSSGGPAVCSAVTLAGNTQVNDVSLVVDGCSNVLDNRASGGFNSIKIIGDCTAAAPMLGTLNALDSHDIAVVANGTPYRLRRTGANTANNVQAAGTTAATATTITYGVSRVTGGTGGLLLPPAIDDTTVQIYNRTAASITAYVNTGNYIDNANFDSSVSVAAGKLATLKCVGAGWIVSGG